MAFPSLPPEAQRDPSGETVTALMNPEWPRWLVLSLQLVRFQTLTTSSQVASTTAQSGLQSWCGSSWNRLGMRIDSSGLMSS